MILKVFSIRDRKVGEYGTPIFYPNKAVALRDYKTAIANGTIKFAEDMELYYLGDYNTENGELLPVLSPEYISIEDKEE